MERASLAHRDTAALSATYPMARFIDVRGLWKAMEDAMTAVQRARTYPVSTEIRPILLRLWQIAKNLNAIAQTADPWYKKIYLKGMCVCCQEAEVVAREALACSSATASEDACLAQSLCQAVRAQYAKEMGEQLGRILSLTRTTAVGALELTGIPPSPQDFEETKITEGFQDRCLKSGKDLLKDLYPAKACHYLFWALEAQYELHPEDAPKQAAMWTTLSYAQLEAGDIEGAVVSGGEAVSIFRQIFSGFVSAADLRFATALWQRGQAQAAKARSGLTPVHEQACCYGQAADSLLLAAEMYKRTSAEQYSQDSLIGRLHALEALVALAQQAQQPAAALHHTHVAALVAAQLQPGDNFLALQNAPLFCANNTNDGLYLYRGYTTSGDLRFARALYDSAILLPRLTTPEEAAQVRSQCGELADRCWFARTMCIQAGPRGELGKADCSFRISQLLLTMAACDGLLGAYELAELRLRRAQEFYCEQVTPQTDQFQNVALAYQAVEQRSD
jgi:hypothetical protein